MIELEFDTAAQRAYLAIDRATNSLALVQAIQSTAPTITNDEAGIYVEAVAEKMKTFRLNAGGQREVWNAVANHAHMSDALTDMAIEHDDAVVANDPKLRQQARELASEYKISMP
jgi:hypothetical protein